LVRNLRKKTKKKRIFQKKVYDGIADRQRSKVGKSVQKKVKPHRKNAFSKKNTDRYFWGMPC